MFYIPELVNLKLWPITWFLFQEIGAKKGPLIGWTGGATSGKTKVKVVSE